MMKVDAIYINGRIYTGDDSFSVAQAMAFRNGRIATVGTNEEVLVQCSADNAPIDLAGRVVLPGLTDAHLHVSMVGEMGLSLDLAGKTKEEILQMVKEAAAKARPGEWITGVGWFNDRWEDTSFPDSRELDAVAPNVPVYLRRACQHMAWGNAKAFEAAGITEDVTNPMGGEFLRRPDGTLLGVVTDQAQEPFNKAIPAYSKEQIREIVLHAQEGFLKAGLTTVHDASTYPEHLEVWKELYEKGELKIRIYCSMRVPGRPSYEEILEQSDEIFEKGLQIGMYDHRLTARAYKLSGDGSLGARSAWMLEDYSDRPGHKGNGKWTDEQLYNLLIKAHRAGFQIWYHAIGDAANRQGLDIYEKLLKEIPQKDHRHRIEHAQILHPDDLPRFKQLGVIPTHQTVFLRSDKTVAEDRIGPERIKGAYAWQTLIQQGNPLPNGTDAPVESYNPFLGFYCAVARKDEHGEPAEGWYPSEAMTREQAFRSYTTWAAYAAFEEEIKGSLEPGKLADCTIIDRDIMECPEEEILETKVLQTIIGGEVVYQEEE